jgi:S1-C subfamily serine protease
MSEFMHKHLLKRLGLAVSLIFLAAAATHSLSLYQSSQQIRQLSQKITVKVTSNHSQGSGILAGCFQKNGKYVYTVITNGHVLGSAKNFKVYLFNNQFYPATVIERFDESEKGDDLAILQFESSDNYLIAEFPGPLYQSVPNEFVYASGFPAMTDQFTFKDGKVSTLLPKPLEGGYQLGYYIDIEKGMSGGPLFNGKGEVIGVNGKHNYPLWGGPDEYYRDGSKINESADLIEKSSWAIPLETVLKRVDQSHLSLNHNKSVNQFSCPSIK